MKRIIFICTVLVMAMATAASGAFIHGELSTAYEVSQDDSAEDEDGDETQTLWETSLRIDDAVLLGPYLNASFYGKYYREEAEDDEDSQNETEIYLAYLHYSSFQDAVELKAGRFVCAGSRFLTLDGALLTARTDYYFGATLFAGSPEYFEIDSRYVNETYRTIGDLLYGGRLFLNGLKHTNGYVSFSREEKDEQTVQELVGAGLEQTISLGKGSLNVGGKMEYDTEQEDIYKGSLRLQIAYGWLTLMADGVRYNVQEGVNGESDLVISNFSTGREDKLSYTVQVALAQSVSIYQSTVLSSIEVADDEHIEGEIYKLGIDIDFFKTIGVTGNIEGYYYHSESYGANGGSLALKWSLTRALRMNFEGELLTLDDDEADDTEIYSLYLSAEYEVLKDLTASLFCENNEETRYLPENRYGLKIAYRF